MVGDPIAEPGLDVAVEAVVRDVEGAADEPLGEREIPFEGGVEVLEPAEVLTGLAGPEGLEVGLGLGVDRVVGHQGLGHQIRRRRERPVLAEVVLDGGFAHG